MRISLKTTTSGAVLTTVLFAFAAFARDHNALNGTWTLVPAKSDFAGQPVVQTGTVTISDRQGIIIVSRNFVYEGATETFFYRDITDAENNATIHSGKDLKSKTRWDHDVLQVTTTQSGAITVERYSLAADRHHDSQRDPAGPQTGHPCVSAQVAAWFYFPSRSGSLASGPALSLTTPVTASCPIAATPWPIVV